VVSSFSTLDVALGVGGDVGFLGHKDDRCRSPKCLRLEEAVRCAASAGRMWVPHLSGISISSYNEYFRIVPGWDKPIPVNTLKTASGTT